MPVEFVPKSKNSFCFGVSNNTWFNLVNNTHICEIIGEQYTTDPVEVTAEQAKQFAEILKQTEFKFDVLTVSENIYNEFIEFFETCEGFYTY